MKKLIYSILLAATAASFLPSCSSDKESKHEKQIKQAIAGLKIPQKVNDNMTFTGCEYKNGTVIYEVEVSKEALAAMDSENKRSGTLENLRTGILPRSLVKSLSSAETSMRFVFYHDKDTLAFTFTPEELNAE